jgi:mRNA-degrading endonuclease toxin of MazEF toxin-antitoxin module
MAFDHRRTCFDVECSGQALSDRSGDSGWHCRIGQASFAVCHQITTLDRAKITKKIGSLPADILTDVELGSKAALDLD